jgi:SAM-dependent methyltransferase
MSEQNPFDIIVRLRQDRDALGHELMSQFNGDQVTEIIERDDGYIVGGLSASFYFADFVDWPVHEQEAMQYLMPGRVLDLGCGAGRAELYLQQQGYEVVGIDNSPLAIEVCQRRGVQDARLLSITQVGLELGLFNNIIMLGNNWGLMGSFNRARWLLRRFHKITTPGARIIASSNDVYATTDPIHLNYQAYNRARGRMSGQLRLRVLFQLHRSNWFDYLIVSRDEMCAILEGTGWRVLRFIDLPERSNYVAVIEKE